ncbi:MAG: N,N-dimethylformamidase beta subunit family domain-containing protein [Actinomycetes bacterium]|jgi:hypothetical protein
MKLTFFSRKIAFFSTISLVAVVAGVMGAYFYGERKGVEEKFPAIISHADLPLRAMQTFADSQNISLPDDSSPFIDSTCPKLSPTWVHDENQKPGVEMDAAKWKRLELPTAHGSALWLDHSSASCGQSIKVHAALYESDNNETVPGPRYIAAWRIGYYNGSGAREVWRSLEIKLKPGKSTTIHDATRYTEARWPVSTTFNVGTDWTPGFYLIVSLSPFGQVENAAPLIVRSPLGSSKMVMMQSFLTWSAYNSFGGRSTYEGPNRDGVSSHSQRSRIASFDRPLLGSGAFALQRDAIPLIQFTESQGLNIDQVSDLDVNQWPSLTSNYNAIIVGGHAEYFTQRMFNTFISARNQGINLAIFGANTAYWQTRLESSRTGVDRHLIMYRKAVDDPNTNVDQVTIQFANPRINTPSNLFTGEQTGGVHVFGTLKPVSIPAWLKVPKNQVISGLSSDTEVEKTVVNAAQPPQVHVLYSGKMTRRDMVHGDLIATPLAQTSWVAYPSGSAGFNAGMTTWGCQLSDSCTDLPFDLASQKLIRSITLQVLTLWQQREVGTLLK